MSTEKSQVKRNVKRLEIEAVRLAGRVSDNQLRFLQVAKTRGQLLEPAGPLAGPSL